MKTLKDFTPEIKAKIPVYQERALRGVFDGGRYRDFNYESAYKAVCLQYEKTGHKKPLMLVAENPYEAQLLLHYIKNNKFWQLVIGSLSQLDSQLDSQLRSQLDRQLDRQLDSQKIKYQNDYLFTLNIWSSAYFAWYQFIAKEFDISAEINTELEVFSTAYENSNIYSALFTEAICIVSKFPKKVYRNAEFNLHNPSGPAVEWGCYSEATKWDCYYINGRNLPAWIWDKAAKNEFTKEDFLKEENSEIKGGIYEVLGQRRIMEMLGAVEIDKKTIAHKNGDLEEVTLLKTKERFAEIDNQPFAWVKMICPSTGTTYLQGVEPHHKNALEAIASLSMFDAKEYSFDLRS